MKKRNYIPDNLKEIVLEAIEKAAESYGIEYNIESVLIYGSTLKDKQNPNDIDIYVHLSNLSSDYVEFEVDVEDEFNREEQQFEIYLSDLIHEALHHELLPEKVNGKPLDIAVKNYEYDYHEKALDLEDYIKENNALKKENKNRHKL